MDNGWTKNHRSMLRCKTASRGIAYFGAMTWLVSKANFEPSWIDGELIGRGQLLSGRSYLAKAWKVGEQTVRTMLKNLEKDGFLTIKSTTQGSVITISNYETYQNNETNDQPSDQPTANQPLTSDQPTTNHLKESKEEYINTPLPPFEPKNGQKQSVKSRLQRAIGRFYRRRTSTKWSAKELKALDIVAGRDGVTTEAAAILRLYRHNYDYYRRDVLTLLNNWPGEVDKARRPATAAAIKTAAKITGIDQKPQEFKQTQRGLGGLGR